MSKPRRKEEIRAAKREEAARLEATARDRALRARRKAPDWQAAFLSELSAGNTLERAAEAAGISRAGVRWARLHDTRFADAFGRAYRASIGVRWSASHDGRMRRAVQR